MPKFMNLSWYHHHRNIVDKINYYHNYRHSIDKIYTSWSVSCDDNDYHHHRNDSCKRSIRPQPRLLHHQPHYAMPLLVWWTLMMTLIWIYSELRLISMIRRVSVKKVGRIPKSYGFSLILQLVLLTKSSFYVSLCFYIENTYCEKKTIRIKLLHNWDS